MIETNRLLFQGREGTQRVRVWLEQGGGGVRLCSHEIGPALERVFGKEDLETFLEVGAVHRANLIAALRAERTDAGAPMDVLALLESKYRGDSAASSSFRMWLTAHAIPYRFTMV